ncbi:hypothetical protein EST35_0056 [Pseudomonas phage vB_PaeM_PA5oct]|uniref:Uncharacterized protein n=1 Tax=Pseudomonas phage vB_PaeM_PA5oct TaxID=2163605 RepID=A0A4Y5JU02_9CAUD|nr:hypothetical protein PQE65_gp426 [Pseudomonas phage vB_PaeM_PA5oct]QCG75939.1 hypothetical protein EST35_0056 [Pseudomonas phage vB_PaeM_PA5oct]WPK40559.1 hypothetical protein Paride_0329 [Pseudomonas phage Paride]
MSRLTAEQARDIARAKDDVDAILNDIAKAAAEGKYVYTTRAYGFGTGGGRRSDAILKVLRSLGYDCAVHAEGRQSVDLWLEVKWGDKP